jgi:fumarate hydratase subunit alpha
MRSQLVELIRVAVTSLPRDVEEALQRALEREENPLARLQLETILKNVAYARERRLPLCQDTGVPIFFVRGFGNLSKVEHEIKQAVREATQAVPLRPSIVDAITRKNTGDNTGEGMPVIHFEGGEEQSITFLAKGAGSENVSRAKMLPASEGVAGIKRFVVEIVRSAGAKPCPPVIVGVGIGGTLDLAAKLAKEALLQPLSQRNPREELSKLEEELLEEINALGIGAMGMGGSTTCLAVKVLASACHTASLPVAVNIQCWAYRWARLRRVDEEWVVEQ